MDLNLLLSYDDFTGKEILSERDLQDHLSRYQDLWPLPKPAGGEEEDISDGIVYEIELIRQIEINIDYCFIESIEV